MATNDEVRKLAALARVRVSDADLDSFVKEFDAILAYVGQLERLDLPSVDATTPLLHNVFREDGGPHESGRYTEAIAAQFPDRDGDALRVKQIISHD